MKSKTIHLVNDHAPGTKTSEDFRILTNQIVQFDSQISSRVEFFKHVSDLLINFSGCDVIEIWLKGHSKQSDFSVLKYNKRSHKWINIPSNCKKSDKILKYESNLEQLCRDIIQGSFDPSLPYFTPKGSFYIGDAGNSTAFHSADNKTIHHYNLRIGNYYRSLAIIPFFIGDERAGLIQLKSQKKHYFTKYQIEFYEDFAQSFGIILLTQNTKVALHERVKELTCLYSISKIVEKSDISLEEILQNTVQLIPPAWQYPEITCCSIVLDGRSYTTPICHISDQKLTANIVVYGEKRGTIEVYYTEKKPMLDKGPFFKEEIKLINTIAKQISIIIEQRQVTEDRAELEAQLRHADRLATIGQLSAGVAHEINEPIGNILGFAQLIKKYPDIPEQAGRDIDKIIGASLHAREVIKKLMLFARQMPPRKTRVNLNQMIEEDLSFLEFRCSKEGVELMYSLSPNLPEITADPSQILQVLVNLIVNAIQAMPEGGRITIKTLEHENHVSLIVEDTGMGMSEKVMKQIFIPFFTTKDVGRGTGIGLSVVHGIVTSHGGTIQVESDIGRGSRFEIRLPKVGVQKIEERD